MARGYNRGDYRAQSAKQSSGSDPRICHQGYRVCQTSDDHNGTRYQAPKPAGNHEFKQ